jgi:hypothetical protein
MNVAGMTMIVRVRMPLMRMMVVVAKALVVRMVAHRDHSTRSGGGSQPCLGLSGEFDTRLRGMD